MIRATFALLGRILLLLAGVLFVAALSIFVFGTFILTWPILRLSPRDQKLRATTNFASSAMTLFTILGQAKAEKAMIDALSLADRDGGDSWPEDSGPATDDESGEWLPKPDRPGTYKGE